MNIYDIAAEAGVSISTVSRVMNHKGNVNPEMKKRIEEVLKKYDYKPSAIARGMVSKTMKTIAIMTVDMRISQFARQIYVIEQEFYQRGYNVMVCNTGDQIENCRRYINVLSEKQVDGIIMIGSVFNKLQENSEITGRVSRIPVIIAGGKAELPNFYSIHADDRGGIRLAADYLWNQGRRGILLVCDLGLESGRQKREGFLEAMSAHGVADGERWVTASTPGVERGSLAVRELLEAGRSFDALIFGEDATAIGAMKELRRRGIRIPEDVAVVGYGNSAGSMICEPELTTVDDKADRIGLLCAKMLYDLLEQKETGPIPAVQPELIVREST